MKISAFDVRDDETFLFDRLAAEMGLEVEMHAESLTPENVHLLQGSQGVSALGRSHFDAWMLGKLKEYGVGFLSSRSVGYEFIDLNAAKALGIHVCHVSYEPESVADHTIMLLLMLLRNYKASAGRQAVNDYTLDGLRGRRVKDVTVGIVGTGRIGLKVMEELSGFGCRILAYDPYPNPKAEAWGQYVPLEQLWEEADCISLHAPFTPENHHLVNRDTLARMKDGVLLLNCARGALMDTEAVIEALETGKVGGLGLDVLEGEEGIYYRDHRLHLLQNRQMAYLRQFPHVVMTPHIAFYTENAVQGMVQGTLQGLLDMSQGRTTPLQLC